MSVKTIIIQAGGKGTRLYPLTKNKPKGIVPVNNKPIIFHLLDMFPDKNFIVIGDYLFDVFQKYLFAFAKVKFIPVKATGTGTCGGLRQALELLPNGEPFMFIWSDLILDAEFNLDFDIEEHHIGISKEFECRWRYDNGVFEEVRSKEHGVAGLFIFKEKACLTDVPENGEFVKWLAESELRFKEIGLYGTTEVGTLDAYGSMEAAEYRCRPFNRLLFTEDTVTKAYVDRQGESLARREIGWYKEALSLGFKQIPEILSYTPLVMKKIDGCNIFKGNYSVQEKRKLIRNLVKSLSELHSLKSSAADSFSIQEAYYTKTMNRLSVVRDLIPFADKHYITVNGKKCRNIFFFQERFYDRVRDVLFDTKFMLIHGDCTFSNVMTDNSLNVTFMDPRGYFGFSELYGDVFYDWAKLYYSIYGNYDQFNNKNFSLDIQEDGITLEIASNGFEDMAEYFLREIPDSNDEKIKLIHAIIWLSLTTYAWEDYDSICGAFYNGLYHLEDLL